MCIISKVPAKKPAIKKADPAPVSQEQTTEIPELGTPKVEVIESKESKIESVESETVLKPHEPRSATFDVLVNGRPRSISKATYMALSRDQHKYKIELPEGSALALIELDPKPCVNC